LPLVREGQDSGDSRWHGSLGPGNAVRGHSGRIPVSTCARQPRSVFFSTVRKLSTSSPMNH
jgi:hypothetical protein